MLPKEAVIRRLVETTLAFHRKFPELENGRIIHGRISVQKRREHAEAIAAVLVKDSSILRIVFSASLSDKEAELQVAKYALKKFGGNAEKAKNFLAEKTGLICQTVASKGFQRLVLRVGKAQNLSRREKREFSGNLAHMIGMEADRLVGLMGAAASQIEKIKAIHGLLIKVAGKKANTH